VAAGVVGASVSRLAAAAEPAAVPKPANSADAPSPLPKGRIGSLEITRLILGTNIITHYLHARGLRYVKDLSMRYNTDEKVLETFAEAERQGVNTFMTHHDARIVKLLKEHHDRHGGKLRWLVSPTPQESKSVEEFSEVVARLAGLGASAVYVHGAAADPLVQSNKGDMLAKFVDIIKRAGLPAGVAAHDLKVVQYCETARIPCDYYVKTFHHLNYPMAPRPEEITGVYEETPHGYWCSNPDETTRVMQSVKQPWIAYKVMAAGAIPPRDAFRYAFSRGADFILAGMFDFQITENAKVTQEMCTRIKERERPWRG
jgi:hypothetical protein